MVLNIDLLNELCSTPAVSGAEYRMRSLIMERAEGLFDEAATDALGNLLLTRHSRRPSPDSKPKKLLILSHMDEIGFLVSYVDKDGFIYVQPVGGFDPRTLFSRRVLVCTDGGDFKGVMNPTGKPLHLASPKDREKIPDISDFFIDIGLGEAATSKVTIGDFVVMDEPFLELGNKCVSKALDNRTACWLGIELLRVLNDEDVQNSCELVVAFTAQEEVGVVFPH